MKMSRAPLASAQAQRQAEEDGVARRDVGDRNAVADAVLGHGDVGGEGRAAERAEIERQDDMTLGQRGGDRSAAVQLDAVALAIVDGQRERRQIRRARQAAQTIESSPPDKRTTAVRCRPDPAHERTRSDRPKAADGLCAQ